MRRHAAGIALASLLCAPALAADADPAAATPEAETGAPVGEAAIPVAVSGSEAAAVEVEADAITRLLVFPIEPSAIGEGPARSLSQLLTYSARQALPEASVLDRTDIDNLLALAENRQLTGCDDGTCLAEIGGALGADYLMVAAVGRVGSRYLIDARLMETHRMETIRHLSEQITGDDDLLAEVISQVAAHLATPEFEYGVATLEVGGRGEVRVDGEPVGTAPLEHRVDPGEHRVAWYEPGSDVPIGERAIVAAKFRRMKVAPEEKAEGLDLSGFWATFGLGNSPSVRARGANAGRAGTFRTEIGWAFQSGLTLQMSRTLQSVQEFRKGGSQDLALATDVGGFGAGYTTEGRLRLHVSLNLGAGRVFSRDEAFGTQGAIGVQPSVTGSWSFARYGQIGIALLGNGIFSEGYNLWSTSVLLMVGIPPRGKGHYAQRDFYKSPWFWAVAVAVIGGAITVSALSDQVGALAVE